jgi:hypothetical protein
MQERQRDAFKTWEAKKGRKEGKKKETLRTGKLETYRDRVGIVVLAC